MVARSTVQPHARWPGQRRVWLRWTLATAAGELFGFAIPALAGAAANWLPLGQIAMSALLVAAGMGEGAVLGLAQWLALRRSVPDLPGRAWVLATALGAGTAWTLAMSLVTLGELNVLGRTALAILALPFGIIFVGAIGGAHVVGPAALRRPRRSVDSRQRRCLASRSGDTSDWPGVAAGHRGGYVDTCGWGDLWAAHGRGRRRDHWWRAGAPGARAGGLALLGR